MNTLKRFGLLVLFGVMVLFFSFYGKTAQFPTRINLITIIGGQAVAVIVALAIVVSATAGVIDLSVGSTTGMASLATAVMMSRFHSPGWVAIAVGLVVGVAIGLVNGVLISRYQFNPLIETLGMSILLQGALQWYTSGTPISSGISDSFLEFGSLNWFGVPRLLVVLLPVIGATWYVLEHTPFGRHLAAIGSNARSARLVGVNVQRTVMSSLAFGGLLAGIAGVLLVARSGRADVSSGSSFLFPALAAVFLGMTTLKLGKPNALGAVVGAYFVATAVSGLTMAGAKAWVTDVFNGSALLLALAFTTRTGTRRSARKQLSDS